MDNFKVRGLIDCRLNTMTSSAQPAAHISSLSGAPKPRLLDQVRLEIRTRHYSYSTEKAYVGWIKRYIFFHNKRHPVLSSLATDSRVSASTQNQALNALLLLYREVLNTSIGYVNGVVRATRPRRLPVVLTREEVRSILGQLQGLNWIMVMLLYGAGLRLMECLRLRAKDIDCSRSEIVVRDGKGGKDRVTIRPTAVKEPLRRHLDWVRTQYQDDLRSGSRGVTLPSCFEPGRARSRESCGPAWREGRVRKGLIVWASSGRVR